MGRGKPAEAGTLVDHSIETESGKLTIAVATVVRFVLATIACAAAAVVVFFTGDNRHGPRRSPRGECSNLNELVRLLKHLDSRMSQAELYNELLPTTAWAPTVARRWGEFSLFKSLSG